MRLTKEQQATRTTATMRSTARCGRGAISNRWFSAIFRPLLTRLVAKALSQAGKRIHYALRLELFAMSCSRVDDLWQRTQAD